MCGITGFNWGDKSLIKKMASAIAHRGPDDSGVYVDKNISLGHRRLSIVDLSKKGHQPMCNKKGEIVVVYNGEIYNYLALKEELKKKGFRFNSTSDTEVIVHGYEAYGEKIFSMLEGMFAIAIWDTKKKKLLLARDRIGKKPLYYYFKKGSFVFGSEIKSMLIFGEIERKVDMQCLSDYLSMRYSTGDETMFEGVKKLLPGKYLIYQKSKVSIKDHWKLPQIVARNEPSESLLDDLMENAVKKRLMGDVPVGVFLSGGLDSSAIVAYMSRATDKINTYSVGFGDVTDETKYAEIVSSKFNTKHKNIHLSKEILSILPKVVWSMDEPMADPAALPTYLLCEKVSKNVKVALSGEGGDEVFGGYHNFNYLKKLYFLRGLPNFIGKGVLSKTALLSSKLFNYPRKQMFKLGAEILSEPKNVISNQKKLFYLPFDEKEKALIFPQKVASKLRLWDPIDRYLYQSGDAWTNTVNYYFKEWLPNDLLMKVDKTSMAHSLEVRAPFLDTDLVKYFSGIDHKYRQNRFLFRKVIRKVLPKKILTKKKQGFTLPITNWFTQKEFVDRLGVHFEDLAERKIFNEERYSQIVKNPKGFRNDHRLWVLLNFELWNKIYMDGTNHKKIRI